MSLLPSVSTASAAQLVAEARRGRSIATSRGVSRHRIRGPPSRSRPAPRGSPSPRGGRRTCRPSVVAPSLVEVEHDDVRLQPLRALARSAQARAPRRSRRCRPPPAPSRSPSAMIGARSPSSTRERGGSSPRIKPLRHAPSGGRAIGQPCVPIRSLLARRACARALRADHEVDAARPGRRSRPAPRRRRRSRATTRCEPGWIRSNRKRPSRSVTVQQAGVGTATHASATGSPVGVARRCRRCGGLGHRPRAARR